MACILSSPMVSSVILLVIGAVLGAALSHWSAKLRDEENHIYRAISEYRAAIALLRAKYDGMGFKVTEFYDESLIDLAVAVHKVKPYLEAEKWNALHDLLKEYRSHYAKRTFEKNAVFGAAVYPDLAPGGKTALQLLEDYLDRFAKAVD